MLEILNELPEIINAICGVLELLIVRLTLLGLTGIGAYYVLSGHFRKRLARAKREQVAINPSARVCR